MPRPGERRELGAVIAEFMRAAETGRVRRPDGRPYGRDELRSLRGGLTHVASELGSRPVGAVRDWQVQSFVYGLRDSGLSPRRLASVVDALRSLYAYAIRRGLVRTSPVVGLAAPEPEYEDDLEPSVPFEKVRTPTDAMLALGDRVVTWTVRIIVIGFALIAVALTVALA